MKLIFAFAAAIFLAACATAAPVIVNAEQSQPGPTAETAFPITCMHQQTFDQVTGDRSRVIEFDDNINDLAVKVHVDHFIDDEQRIIVIYHTFDSAPGLVCILHATPADGAQYFLEDLI